MTSLHPSYTMRRVLAVAVLFVLTQEGLHAWEGSSLADVLRSQGQLAPGSSSSNSSSRGGQTDPQQQQQQTLHRVHDALTCFTSGLGLEAWQFEECVTATAKVHVASQRNTGVYPQYNSSRYVQGVVGMHCTVLS